MDLHEEWQAHYITLTHLVGGSRARVLRQHLRQWFDHLDEVPAAVRFVRGLEASADLDGWLARQQDAGEGADLLWPDKKHERLGTQALLFRRIAEGKLDAFDFALNYLDYVGDEDMAAVHLANQIFHPLSSDLLRELKRLDERTIANDVDDEPAAVPASDRLVALDHNAPEAVEVEAGLGALSDAIRGANDVPPAVDKPQVEAEVTAARGLLRVGKIRADLFVTAVLRTLRAIGKLFTDGVIKALVAHLITLITKWVGWTG